MSSEVTSSRQIISLVDDDSFFVKNEAKTNTNGLTRIVSADTVVLGKEDTHKEYLPQKEFPVGTVCNAKSSVGKVWDVATILGYNADYTEVRLKWNMSGFEYSTEFVKENVQSLNEGRVRKVKVNLFEDEQHLRSLIGIRPMKEKKEKVPLPDGEKAHRAIAQKDIHSTTLEEVRAAEHTADRSLSVHLPQFKMFISAKVYERMRHASLGKTPVADNTVNITDTISTSDSLNLDSSVVTSSSSSSESAVQNNSNIVINKKLSQPFTIKNVEMRDYQLLGLSWMVSQYDKCINSILADEMGLGKTLQTISFISYLKDVRKVKGPHLVVVPLSVIFNWIAECRKFCPTLRVLRLHSNSADEMKTLKAKLIQDDSYDLCVTSYEMVKSGGMSNTLAHMVWRTVILDEGHRIKNLDTFISKACMRLRSRFKLILTGTPVQNNLFESFCLLHYLCPKVFEEESSEIFRTCFQLSSAAINVDRGVLDAAHYLMRPFVLRRIKTEVEQKLPPKLETMIRCPLAEMQRFWIRRLLLKESGTIMQLVNGNGDEASAKAQDAWKKLQSLLAQLRKASNHPYLFPGAEDPDNQGGPCGEDIVTASGKMMVLDRLLAKLQAKGHRVVLFSQFTRTLDIIHDYLEMRGYNHCRLDGSTNRVLREVYINQFNNKDSKMFIFCLSTRAGGEGVNLFTADTVILFDSDWNPQKDIQAMARVHRIGQTKPVHIYRLVSEGTVEERIVQRAQKKLFLDSMINRGSTTQALEIDEQLERKKQPFGRESIEDGAEDDVDSSTLMSALKFGWNSCFSAKTGEDGEDTISDADLDAIIDRTRGLNGDTTAATMGVGTKKTSGSDKAEEDATSTGEQSIIRATTMQLAENLESTVADFDESAPLTNIRLFEGETLKNVSKSSMGDISREWIQAVARERTSRLVTTHVVGVGKVQVLKANRYTLEDGEPSVFDKEFGKGVRAQYAEPKRKREVYTNQDFCQVCWDYGNLVCCSMCPASYHAKCAGLKKVPDVAWKCPHHLGCADCGKSGASAGFVFRCEMCAHSYCEDCIPADQKFVGTCERFAELNYKMPGNTCYVQCCESCQQFADAQSAAIAAAPPAKSSKKASKATSKK